MNNIVYRVLGSIFLPFLFGIVGFAYGLYFPIESAQMYGTPARKIKWYSYPGMFLGMVICSIGFAISMFVFGLIFSWLDMFEKQAEYPIY